MNRIAKGDTCEVCGTTEGRIHWSNKFNKTLCNRHYLQMKLYGKILERTIFDRNEIVIKDDYAEIILYDRQNKEHARALINIEDVSKVKPYKWHISDKDNYVTKNSYPKGLHRLVMNNPKGYEIDHINHNPLDNRKSNLRIATRGQNSMNHKVQCNNTSGYKGVSWVERLQKWEVYIRMDGKKVNLGIYKDIQEAVAVRKKAEEETYGEFAYQEANL